ncbi:polysaccharide biosynthesis tyrosine autokinase [Skermanella sp. TT6]|uniref:non-specific protein-tyrosine kinase n=1 Tax=Skermanella cutis TaxID=2775420 RepID=A0ABX7BBC7_9PROT|nr:polysaccharide biosynthesis tyrosine autokinase [Skermanella sp. TT6]QQP90376.1 polysaccharide biosynthesis tyrosine autokinase [Skermanella sp. TT6]
MNKLLTPDRQETDRHDWTTHEEGPSRSAPTLGLGDLLMVLSRRKYLLLGTIAIVTLLGIINVYMMTPLYTANTSVMVDPREQRVVDVEALVTGAPADQSTIESEIQVIRSDELAMRVIRQLGLDQLAEFNPRVAAEQNADSFKLPSLRDLPPVQWVKSLLVTEEPVVPDPAAEEARLQTSMLTTFLGRLSVSAVGRSRVLTISFTSENPTLAANVANTIASLYITQQLEQKFDARQKANAWLGERLTRLREEVETAERAVETARAGLGVVQGRDAGLVNEQLTQLNTQLVMARAENNTTQAQLRSVESAVRARGVRAVFDVVDSTLVSGLRAQEATLRQREAELLNNLGPRHPTIVDLKSQISAIAGEINNEAENRLRALRAQASVTQQRVTSLEQSMSRLEQEAGRLNQSDVEIRALQREAEANRALFENFLARSKETQSVDLEQPNAWIVSTASAPLGPSFPSKPLFVAVALVLAIGLGLILVFLAEQLERGLQTQEDVERLLRMPSLGMIPLVRRGRLTRKAPQDYALDKPASAYSQAVKSLFTSLIIAHQRKGSGNIVMLTSAVPGEGKSSLAATLARVIAIAGRRVLIIDCDLRRPNIHRTLGLPNQLGLADFLHGDATLPDVMRTDTRTGADVITAGSPTDYPEETIRNPLFDQMLFNLRPQYDLILLDAPPVLPVSDTRILAEKASQTVVVAKWRRTPRKLVQLAIRQLGDAGANIAGVALNQVDTAKAARYGSGEVEYYMGRRGSYFKN